MNHSVSVSESRVEIRWLPRKTQCQAYVTITHALLFVRRWKSNEIVNLRVSFFFLLLFFITIFIYRWWKKKKKDRWKRRKRWWKMSASEDERKKIFFSFFIFIYLWLWLMRKVRTRKKVKDVILFSFFFKYLLNPNW